MDESLICILGNNCLFNYAIGPLPSLITPHKKSNPPHLHVAGSGLLSLFRRQIFLVMRAHDADELTLCHHALHQRAKGLIYLEFFQSNK
jgi:hypothetical protein